MDRRISGVEGGLRQSRNEPAGLLEARGLPTYLVLKV